MFVLWKFAEKKIYFAILQFFDTNTNKSFWHCFILNLTLTFLALIIKNRKEVRKLEDHLKVFDTLIINGPNMVITTLIADIDTFKAIQFDPIDFNLPYNFHLPETNDNWIETDTDKCEKNELPVLESKEIE